jgi:hypothetical protein
VGIIDPAVVVRQHMAACSTALKSTSEFGIDPHNVFGFWDWVGGRFSVHSAVRIGRGGERGGGAGAGGLVFVAITCIF